MRVGHSIAVGTRCGLFSSARSLIAAERDAGVDAWFVPLDSVKGGILEGIPCAERLENCNVIVSHSGLSHEQVSTGLPIVHMLHAQPRYKFETELQGQSGNFYAAHPGPASHDGYKAFVTFYPEHVQYWSRWLTGKDIYVIDPPADLNKWSPGDRNYDFGGKRGAINLVVADTWRSTQDPYEIIHAVMYFAERHNGVRLHIYGIGRGTEHLQPAWRGILARLEQLDILGEVEPWCDHMVDVYRAADMVLSAQRSANNVMRESLACGCPVVADRACAHTEWRADVCDPQAYCGAMCALQTRLERDAEAVRAERRAWAERYFDVRRSAAQLIDVLKSVEDGSSTTLCSPSVPWFDEGLRFECKRGCTFCCANSEAIVTTKAEIDAISAHLGHDESHNFVQTDRGWQIRKLSDGNCPYNTGAGCRLHGGPKPTMCDTFPFWQKYISSRRAWEELATWCPGANHGNMHGMDEINTKRHKTSVTLLHANGERGGK